MKINKSLVTNVVSVALIGVGYAIPSSSIFAKPIREIGLYATSGAITNWIAIYMLFERVPGFYGSGVVPLRFEEFKIAIRNMIMEQFFNRANIEKFFKEEGATKGLTLEAEPILEIVDYDAMFQRLTDAVLGSPFGGMLGMFGGAKALQPLREPFEKNIREEIRGLIASPKLAEALQSSMKLDSHADEIVAKVDAIVVRRLDELTPQMVKQIVEEMISEHLGWLVVWGGVFGAIIGLVAAILL